MAFTSKLESRRRPFLWLASYAAWILIAVVTALPMYRFEWMFDRPTTFWAELIVPLVNNLIYATFTPILVEAGINFPLQRTTWKLRGSMYTLGAVVFTAAHALVRILVYPVIDSMTHEAVPVNWNLFQRVFLFDFASDCFYVYVPIVLATHLWLYYREARERALQASQLKTRLVEAQLKALKSQLQPHFLFNTLHSISSLMMVDVNAADKMVALLSDLLRMSLEGGDCQETTLNRELQFVSRYLEIEKMRFSDRLDVKIAVETDTLDARVPHLLLQPLVENAIRHGVARLSSRGEVRIAARRQNGSLLIEVGDNGPGFQAHPRNGRQGTGVGLTATRERLTGLYGDRGSIAIKSVAVHGTVVQIMLPFNIEPVSAIAASESMHGLV